MGKGNDSKTAGLAMIAVVVVVVLAATYFGAFGGVWGWPRRYEAWQLGPLLVASGLGLYHRRETTRLRRETEEHKREVAELRREVADLRRTKEALRRNEARYRGVVAGLPVALFAVDGEGVFTLAEGKGLDALGLGPEKVVGRSIFEVYSDAPQIVENVRFALAGKGFDAIVEVGGLAFETEDTRTDETLEPFRTEYRMFAKDDRVVWVRDEAVVVRDESGRPSFWQGVMFDVTEQKRAEERLREAEARYRTLVEQIPASVYIQGLEHEGAIDYISPRIEDVLGYSPREYVENPGLWVETTHPEDRERVLAEDARTDETGEPFRMEFRKIARDGRVLWMRDEAVLVKDAEGRLLYMFPLGVEVFVHPWRRQPLLDPLIRPSQERSVLELELWVL